MSNKANQVMELLNGPEFKNRIIEVIDHVKADRKQKKEITRYSEHLIVEIYKSALEYSLFINHESLDDEEIAEMQDQFRHQLSYWWIQLQSEWVRNNSLLNYKKTLKGEDDPVLQGKCSVGSLFLGPLANFLEGEDLKGNLDYLSGLINRSQYEGMFADSSGGHSSTS